MMVFCNSASIILDPVLFNNNAPLFLCVWPVLYYWLVTWKVVLSKSTIKSPWSDLPDAPTWWQANSQSLIRHIRPAKIGIVTFSLSYSNWVRQTLSETMGLCRCAAGSWQPLPSFPQSCWWAPELTLSSCEQISWRGKVLEDNEKR